MEKVQAWLCDNGFGEYVQNFEDNGWDDLTLLSEMTNVQIRKCIHKEGHVAKFRKAARRLKKDSKDDQDEGIIVYDRYLNTQSAGYTNETQPIASKRLFGDEMLSNLTTAESTLDIGRLRQLTLDNGDLNGRNSEAGIVNRGSADIYSSTQNDNFSSAELSTRSFEDESSYVIEMVDSDSDVNALAEKGQLPASTSDQAPMHFTFIAHSDCTTVNKDVTQIIPGIGHSTSTNENLKDQMETVADWYEKPDRLFVETRAFRECKKILDDRHWVTILGKPGDGKSMMAAHLMSQYRHKGFEPVFITSVQDCKNLLSCGQVKQFVVIDDIFGSTCLDRLKLNEWVSYICIIEKIIEKGQGKLLVVCTSRKHIFEDAKSSLSKFRSFTVHTLLDLTSHDWKLTIEEKEEIFDKHAREHNIDGYSAQDVARLDPPHGYPHCVVMFCTNIFLRKTGLDFFKNPTECIQEEIHSFRKNDRVKYLVLLLGLMYNTGLDVPSIEKLCYEPTEVTTKLFKAAGVSRDTALPDICSALESLENIYFDKDLNGRFHFTHESFSENVASVFLAVNPVLAIETVEFRFLFTKLKSGKSILSLERSAKHVRVSVHEDHMEPLTRRITMELTKSNSFYVIMCDIWRDQNFVNDWVKYVNDMDVNAIHKLFRPDKNISRNLLLEFIHLNKENVVKTILHNDILCDKLNLTDFLQQCLEVACARNCSPELVKTIISYSNATSKKLLGSELLMDALDKSNLVHANLLLEYTSINRQYVDNFERGFLHKLVRAQLKRVDEDIFEKILKTLLEFGHNINAQDCLGESPFDFCTNKFQRMLVYDENEEVSFIYHCLVRNGCKPLVDQASLYIRSCFFQAFHKLHINHNYATTLTECVLNEHYGSLLEDPELEGALIFALEYTSKHMKNFATCATFLATCATWATFLQRVLDDICKGETNHAKLVKTLTTSLPGDYDHKLDGSTAFLNTIRALNAEHATVLVQTTTINPEYLFDSVGGECFLLDLLYNVDLTRFHDDRDLKRQYFCSLVLRWDISLCSKFKFLENHFWNIVRQLWHLGSMVHVDTKGDLLSQFKLLLECLISCTDDRYSKIPITEEEMCECIDIIENLHYYLREADMAADKLVQQNQFYRKLVVPDLRDTTGTNKHLSLLDMINGFRNGLEKCEVLLNVLHTNRSE